MATGKLSDYISEMRNGTYINPVSAQKHIEENSTSQSDPLFAKVFPLPDYYGVAPVQGGFTVTTYETRTKATDARNKSGDSGMRTFRDYFIMNTEEFEEYLDKNMSEFGYKRMPSNIGKKKPAATGFASAEYLASLSPEAAAQYAAELASTKLGKGKRTQSEAAKIALEKYRKEKEAAKGKADTDTKSTAAKGGTKRK